MMLYVQEVKKEFNNAHIHNGVVIIVIIIRNAYNYFAAIMVLSQIKADLFMVNREYWMLDIKVK